MSSAASAGAAPRVKAVSLRRGLFIQWQVVHALILRETRTRFGQHQLGFLWALIEPIFGIGTFVILFTLMGRPAPTGMDLFGFLVTGFVTFQGFTGTVNAVSHAIGGNRGLLFYPQVQPLDLIISRTLLETATLITVFAIFMGGESLYLAKFSPDNLLLLLGGLLLAATMGAGLGMFIGALALHFPSVEKITGFLMRPLFWLSGLFFSANEVPMELLQIIQYNPILHCVEMVREGWYYEYTSRVLSVAYPVGWMLGFVFFGLILERASRARIELT